MIEKSAETPELSTHHAPIGHEGVWHSEHPLMQLPAYLGGHPKYQECADARWS